MAEDEESGRPQLAAPTLLFLYRPHPAQVTRRVQTGAGEVGEERVAGPRGNGGGAVGGGSPTPHALGHARRSPSTLGPSRRSLSQSSFRTIPPQPAPLPSGEEESLRFSREREGEGARLVRGGHFFSEGTHFGRGGWNSSSSQPRRNQRTNAVLGILSAAHAKDHGGDALEFM